MSRFFDITPGSLPGLTVLQRRSVGDHRGSLGRLYCATEFSSFIGSRTIVQINRTLTSRRGTIRGMHFQHRPFAEMKLVSCLRGEVFDVAVDLRRGSPTFLRWHAEVLSAGNERTLVIPEGFAHGFQTCTDDCEMLYFHTAAYEPTAEGGINALDPKLAIEWPIAVGERSERDGAHPLLASDFPGIEP